MFNKFTNKSQEAIRHGQQIAIDKANQQVDVLHLLLSLISQDDSLVVTILRKLEIDLSKLKNLLYGQIDLLPKAQVEISMTQMFLTEGLARIFSGAELEAK